MQYPASTGLVAESLEISVSQLNDLLRQGRIHPAPKVWAGRRMWERAHVRQATRVVEKSTLRKLGSA